MRKNQLFAITAFAVLCFVLCGMTAAAPAPNIITTVQNEQGKPLQSAIVYLTSSDISISVGVSTDKDGHAVFSGLSAANGYSISVYASGYEREERTISLSASQPRVETVKLKKEVVVPATQIAFSGH